MSAVVSRKWVATHCVSSNSLHVWWLQIEYLMHALYFQTPLKWNTHILLPGEIRGWREWVATLGDVSRYKSLPDIWCKYKSREKTQLSCNFRKRWPTTYFQRVEIILLTPIIVGGNLRFQSPTLLQPKYKFCTYQSLASAVREVQTSFKDRMSNRVCNPRFCPTFSTESNFDACPVSSNVWMIWILGWILQVMFQVDPNGLQPLVMLTGARIREVYHSPASRQGRKKPSCNSRKGTTCNLPHFDSWNSFDFLSLHRMRYPHQDLQLDCD